MADKNLLSEKFRNAIEDTDFTDDALAGLYDAVENMNDEDFKEYMYSNRGYFEKNMPAAVEEVAGFRDLISKEPEFGVKKTIDYEKVTGSPDALDRFYDYNMKDFDYFGSQVGLTGKEFMKRMAEDKTALDRQRIARGEDEGGWLDSPKAFFKNTAGMLHGLGWPRVREAIERGEDPSNKDYVADAGQNLLYAMPYSKIPLVAKTATIAPKELAAIEREFPRIYKLLKGTEKVANGPLAAPEKLMRKAMKSSPNLVAPLGTETLDWMAYRDTDNPRGDFSLADVGTGWLVNNYAGKRIEPKIVKHLGGSLGSAVTPYVTNKAGDMMFENKKLGQIPLPGASFVTKKIQEGIDENEKTKKRQKARAKAEPRWQYEWRKVLENIEKDSD